MAHANYYAVAYLVSKTQSYELFIKTFPKCLDVQRATGLVSRPYRTVCQVEIGY